MSILSDVSDIAKAPFTGELSLKDLFLLIGVVLVFIAIWLFIIAHIRGAAMEVIDAAT